MSTPAKEIVFEEAARDKLRVGINKLADVIACTLGPKGRTVGLEKSWGSPSITNDGNSIVKDVELEDVYENMGVSIAKEVVTKLKDKCGDGTTTGVLLLNALVENGVKNIASGASPIGVKRGIDKAVAAIVEEIEKRSIPVEDTAATQNIATAAASGDEFTGRTIAEAIEKVGKEGVVTIEESKTTETTIELVEGMQFDRGYLSPYFCTDGDKMEAVLQQPQILLVDKKISSIHDLLPVLQNVATSGQELLIIAEDLEGDALSTLVINKLRGSLKVTAVKAPGFGDRRKAMLEDIAALTGGTVVNEDAGVSLKELPADALGTAEKVVVTKEATTIVNGGGSEEAIQARIHVIEAEKENASNSYDQEKLAERKAKLSGGVAVIRVGASTEPELKHKKQLFEDSLSSTHAALEEGIVTGAGVTLLLASEVIEGLGLKGDEHIGAKLVAKACEAPARQLIKNCGFDASVILAEIREKGGNYGFNQLTETVEDLMTSGITDPAKVIKNSLKHASSAAGIVLISEALMADAPEDEE